MCVQCFYRIDYLDSLSPSRASVIFHNWFGSEPVEKPISSFCNRGISWQLIKICLWGESC